MTISRKLGLPPLLATLPHGQVLSFLFPVQLLRVVVPADLGIDPEISGSHYRSSVRFVLWQSPEERPRQAQQDTPFEMICCG
jgi:cell division FtsZ-interacting protein ZapD